MDGINDAGTWDWEDETFSLDVDSTFFSQSLWDDCSQSETDVSALFPSTAASDIASTESSGVTMFGQEKILPQPCVMDYINLSEDSPPLKRGKMLDILESDSFNESFQSQEPSSGCSTWYIGNDDSLSSMDDGTELSGESWMARCFGDRKEQLDQDQDQTNIKSSMSIMRENHIVRRQREAGQGIQRLISACRGTAAGRKTGRKVSKLAIPVAYPFTLIKPTGMQGDVTLKDINQRIMLPPSRPTSQVTIGGDKTPPPSSSILSDPASSGKSVVALTKVYTEGRGTITIMRTRN